MTRDGCDLSAVLRQAIAKLNDAGIDNAAADGRILAAAAFGLSREDMLRDPALLLDPAKIAAFDAFIARRVAREPVSRILGRREFRSLTFEIAPATLDPRPDSEALVEAALDIASGRSGALRLLDIGTGSGCLLLSILRDLPDATGIGTDIDAAAVACAQRNASNLCLTERVEFVTTSWADGVAGPFDIVLSNPPYIPTGDIRDLSAEVAIFDPVAALDGGPDGLDAYRALATRMDAILAPGGALLLEIGAGQAADVETIFGVAQFALTGKRADLAGRDRVLIFSRNPAPNG